MNAGASAAPSRGFRYPLSLLAIFAAWWAGMAIKPWDRHDWVLENVLAVLFVAGLLWTTISPRAAFLYLAAWMCVSLAAFAAANRGR